MPEPLGRSIMPPIEIPWGRTMLVPSVSRPITIQPVPGPRELPRPSGVPFQLEEGLAAILAALERMERRPYVGLLMGLVTATAGTAVRFSTEPLKISQVDISAMRLNTNAVYVGTSNVRATAATARGMAIYPSQNPYTMHVHDLSHLWLDTVTSGEGITFLAYLF